MERYQTPMTIEDVPETMMKYIIDLNKIQVLDKLKSLSKVVMDLEHLVPKCRGLHKELAELLPEKERIHFNVFLYEHDRIVQDEEEEKSVDAQVRLDEPLPEPSPVLQPEPTKKVDLTRERADAISRVKQHIDYSRIYF